MDQGAYLALAAALTVLGAIWTWVAFRRRGLGAGVRAFGWTLLAPAAYLTGLLRAGSRIVDAIGDWAARLVFSPTVWIGFGLAALAIVLIFVSRLLPTKEKPSRAARKGAAGAAPAGSAGPASVAAPRTAKGPVVDDDDEDMADVNDILKKYGIS
ncbi:hypothetical protein ACIRON_15255 [Nocardioides sp. NPDC101246]|uniref:hypothetical protein n=1 Tax=unclassified Nocardioides TaxID=2615069 RepID=UPI0008857F90|nr:hypothetical protein [Nocardioides sp. YR527]SDJ88762.1 hypothetical protein SAMN05428985_101891 [Nocardioides sp. YR527]